MNGNENENKSSAWHQPLCLLEKHLTRPNHAQKLIQLVNGMGRICVDISDEIKKELIFKTVEKFGGRKGDLAKAVEEAVKTWVATKE